MSVKSIMSSKTICPNTFFLILYFRYYKIRYITGLYWLWLSMLNYVNISMRPSSITQCIIPINSSYLICSSSPRNGETYLSDLYATRKDHSLDLFPNRFSGATTSSSKLFPGSWFNWSHNLIILWSKLFSCTLVAPYVC